MQRSISQYWSKLEQAWPNSIVGYVYSSYYPLIIWHSHGKYQCWIGKWSTHDILFFLIAGGQPYFRTRETIFVHWVKLFQLLYPLLRKRSWAWTRWSDLEWCGAVAAIGSSRCSTSFEVTYNMEVWGTTNNQEHVWSPKPKVAKNSGLNESERVSKELRRDLGWG